MPLAAASARAARESGSRAALVDEASAKEREKKERMGKQGASCFVFRSAMRSMPARAACEGGNVARLPAC